MAVARRHGGRNTFKRDTVIVSGGTGAAFDADAEFGTTQGSVIYRDASAWVPLAPGTSGQFLKTLGAAANPAWASTPAVTSADLDSVLGSTQGTVAYRSATGWTSLPTSTAGYVLSTNGAGANPSWIARLSASVAETIGALWNFTVGIKIAAGPTITASTGTPEGVVTAPVGSLFLRTDGGTDTSIYKKETGAGNTGWVAIGAPALASLSVSAADRLIGRGHGAGAGAAQEITLGSGLSMTGTQLDTVNSIGLTLKLSRGLFRR